MNLHETKKSRRAFFKYHGTGPWTCFFCGEEVDSTEDDRRDGLHVHHEDGDTERNTPDNLKPAHGRCHNRHHLTGNKRGVGNRCAPGCTCHRHNPSEETRARISAAVKDHIKRHGLSPRSRCEPGCTCGRHRR